ncbi:M24 family metallopeptidase [Mesorhizobium sp. B2-3-11]|uniref:M24 family metallopeptidase n=1 Tax=Mesorhizobium sp. B2-3-11 TaxID=2589953 RepID=UPI0015E2E27A|nr:M24 family metallopeptidase [Mesorhizobium sp. B2-3-11]
MNVHVEDDPPEGLIEAQRLAIRIAEAIAADAQPGETEIEVRDRADRYVKDLGGIGVWTPTTIGFGQGTLSCFPTDKPSLRVLWNLDLGMIDVHPITQTGWWGDCTRTFIRGGNPAQAKALETVDAIHATVLASVTPGMRACDLFAVFLRELERTPYVLLDRLSNIGHSLSASSSYDGGYIDAWNSTPMTGAWAIEPFIGNHLFGVKREDVVWFGQRNCTIVQ